MIERLACAQVFNFKIVSSGFRNDSGRRMAVIVRTFGTFGSSGVRAVVSDICSVKLIDDALIFRQLEEKGVVDRNVMEGRMVLD